MDELKSCPFCGGEDIGIKTKLLKESDGFVDEVETFCGCESCGAGIIEETKEYAIQIWNRRANP